jgi:hypothetical protein
MDGVMFMHSRRLESIRAALNDGESVGTLRRLMMGFSFCAPPEFFAGNIRAHSGLEPAGCVGDLGWYCIRLVLHPVRALGAGLADAHGSYGADACPSFPWR